MYKQKVVKQKQNIGRYVIGYVEASPKELLEFSLKIGALELLPDGRKLKSGRISPYFFNSGLFNSGNAIDIIALSYAAKIVEMDVYPEYIFGPAYKGIPLCAAIALQFYRLTGKDIKYAFDRKEEKDHGEGGIIVGLPPGKNGFDRARVVIVDDVMTTNKSCSDADTLIKNFDGFPVACVIGFDRQERGTDSDFSAVQMFTEKTGVPVNSVMNFGMLIDSLVDNNTNNWWKMLPKLEAYREMYGVN